MAETEAVLLQRFAHTGDAEAFSEIIRRHAGLVYGSALRILADVDRAADVTQETFLQLTKDAYEVTGSLPGWLHRVATRKAIDQMRRESARRRREARYAADHVRAEGQWSDISPYVDEELDALDGEMRDILVAHFLEGRTTRHIAAARGISQATVSRRIEAGVANLRGALRRRGIIVAAGGLGLLLSENTTQAAPAALMTELGKLALVGSHISAVSTASGSGVAGLKAAVNAILSSATGKVAAVASATIIVAGSAVVYHEGIDSARRAPETSSVMQEQADANTDANVAGRLAFGDQDVGEEAGPLFVLPDLPPEPDGSQDDAATASTPSLPEDPNRSGT